MKDFLIKGKLFSSWQLSIITYTSKFNLKYLVSFIFLFLLKPIPELDGILLCLFFISLFLIWFFVCINLYLMFHFKILFVKQHLRDKLRPWIVFLKTTQGSFLWTPLTLFVLYYFLTTIWDFLYCCSKLQDSETLLCTSLSKCCSSLLSFVLALNFQIWLLVFFWICCNNCFFMPILCL